MPALTDLEVNAAMSKILIRHFSIPNKIPLILKGVPRPNLESYDDWCRFTVLKRMPRSSRVNHVTWHIEFAISSKKAQYRDDASFDAPYRIWDIARKFFNNAYYKINNSCIQGKESDTTHLDNRTIGQGFDPASVTSPDSNVHTLLCFTPFVEISTKTTGDINHVWNP